MKTDVMSLSSKINPIVMGKSGFSERFGYLIFFALELLLLLPVFQSAGSVIASMCIFR